MSGWFSKVLRRFRRPRAGRTGDDYGASPEWEMATRRARADMEARQRAVAPYGGAVAEVSAALYRHDPLGLAGESAISDEYDSEAETIILRLVDLASHGEMLSKEDALSIVHEEFVSWFDAALAGPSGRYADVADDVVEIWSRHGSGG